MEILMDLVSSYHYYVDQHMLAAAVRQDSYITALADLHVNTNYITDMSYMSDSEFGAYLDNLTISDYLEMNNARHPDEILLIDEFGRLVFNQGYETVIDFLEKGNGEIQVGLGTAVLGDSIQTSRSMVTIFVNILHNMYKAVTVGYDSLLGTSEKRAIMASGSMRLAEGFAHLVGGVSNLTYSTIEYYGEYRDRNTRVEMGIASEEDVQLYNESAQWWNAAKESAKPWNWNIHPKPPSLEQMHRESLHKMSQTPASSMCEVALRASALNDEHHRTKRMHARQRPITEHMKDIADGIEILTTPTTEAQGRYDRIMDIFSDSMDYFYYGLRNGMQPIPTKITPVFRTPRTDESPFPMHRRRSAIVPAASAATGTIGITIQSFVIGLPTCMTNYTSVCEHCIVLENGIGVVLQASGSFLNYANMQFNNDIAARREFLDYTYDDNAIVLVGQRPGLPVWFPLPNVSSYDYIGPPENVTTIGFSDYQNITSLLPSSVGLIRSELQPGSLYYTAFAIFDAYGRPVVSYIEQYVTWFSTGTSDGSGEEESLIGKILDDILFCDFESELDGSAQRYSVPIALFIALISYFMVRSVITLVFETNGIISTLLPSFMIAIYLFLYLAFNWSVFCFPALPLPLPRQLFESIAFTALPKCLYYFTGLLEEGHYHSNAYCASVELSRTVSAYSCRTDGQFYDIISHLAFTTVNFWPSGVSYIQDIPLIGNYVDIYTSVDMSDPVLYSFTHTCNFVFGFTNFSLTIIGIYGAFIFSDVALSLLRVLASPIFILSDLFNTTYLAIAEINYMFSVISSNPRPGDSDGPPDFNDGFELESPTNFGDQALFVDMPEAPDDLAVTSPLISDTGNTHTPTPRLVINPRKDHPSLLRRNKGRKVHMPFGLNQLKEPTSSAARNFQRL
jgi:hypothetical protein